MSGRACTKRQYTTSPPVCGDAPTRPGEPPPDRGAGTIAPGLPTLWGGAPAACPGPRGVASARGDCCRLACSDARLEGPPPRVSPPGSVHLPERLLPRPPPPARAAGARAVRQRL